MVFSVFQPLNVKKTLPEERLRDPAYVGGDVTNAASLRAAADLLKGELLISCEGLTQYLSADELAQFIGGIREILIRRGGAWVTSDFGVDYEAFATANMTSPDAVKLYNAARRQATSASNIYNEGVAYWDVERKQAFLEAHGMIVEKLPFWAEDERLKPARKYAGGVAGQHQAPAQILFHLENDGRSGL